MFQFGRRARAPPPPPPKSEDETTNDRGSDGSDALKPQGSNNGVTKDQEPVVATEDQQAVKGDEVSQEDSTPLDNTRDYIGVQSMPYLMKLLDKQGNKKVLFADKVLKYTCSGKMRRRVLIITEFALYIVDPETDSFRRRIALAAVGKLCLSKLSDNFFAIIIPREYDLLMASTRKTEIVAVLVRATKSASDYVIEVSQSNRFEYHAASKVVKEIQFEEVEGGVKTSILKK